MKSMSIRYHLYYIFVSFCVAGDCCMADFFQVYLGALGHHHSKASRLSKLLNLNLWWTLSGIVQNWREITLTILVKEHVPDCIVPEWNWRARPYGKDGAQIRESRHTKYPMKILHETCLNVWIHHHNNVRLWRRNVDSHLVNF